MGILFLNSQILLEFVTNLYHHHIQFQGCMAFALLDPQEWVLYVLSLVDSLHLFELVLALPVLLPAARLHSWLCIFLSETKPSAHMALHNDVNNTKRAYKDL